MPRIGVQFYETPKTQRNKSQREGELGKVFYKFNRSSLKYTYTQNYLLLNITGFRLKNYGNRNKSVFFLPLILCVISNVFNTLSTEVVKLMER